MRHKAMMHLWTTAIMSWVVCVTEGHLLGALGHCRQSGAVDAFAIAALGYESSSVSQCDTQGVFGKGCKSLAPSNWHQNLHLPSKQRVPIGLQNKLAPLYSVVSPRDSNGLQLACRTRTASPRSHNRAHLLRPFPPPRHFFPLVVAACFPRRRLVPPPPPFPPSMEASLSPSSALLVGLRHRKRRVGSRGLPRVTSPLLAPIGAEGGGICHGRCVGERGNPRAESKKHASPLLGWRRLGRPATAKSVLLCLHLRAGELDPGAGEISSRRGWCRPGVRRSRATRMEGIGGTSAMERGKSGREEGWDPPRQPFSTSSKHGAAKFFCHGYCSKFTVQQFCPYGQTSKHAHNPAIYSIHFDNAHMRCSSRVISCASATVRVVFLPILSVLLILCLNFKGKKRLFRMCVLWRESIGKLEKEFCEIGVM